MTDYKIILSKQAFSNIEAYKNESLKNGAIGYHMANQIKGLNVLELKTVDVLSALLNSKKPQIFAESMISADESDWTLQELSLLGDMNVAMEITVYDNGAHQNPIVHSDPFQGHLIYTPGALLRNDQGGVPADWRAVMSDGVFNKDLYYCLYEGRLLPAFRYINQQAIVRGKPAFVTMPGLGCGQFAGEFQGQMGHVLRAALVRLLENYGSEFPGIRAVYYDPYNEYGNQRICPGGIDFFVRPLLMGNETKSQLCHPTSFEEDGDDFSNCELYSFVAWDHVSWPGNDYYRGSRVTDDGVKAAATNTMEVMTGLKGHYNFERSKYMPPEGFTNWYSVVAENNILIRVDDNLYIA